MFLSAFFFFAILASEALAITQSGTVLCIFSHCLSRSVSCFRNKTCRKAITCNKKCAKSPDAAACNLLCQLTYGYDNRQYIDLVRCMSTHGCLPKLPPDGKCLAKREDGIKELTDISQIQGTWWILKGLNCGQPGWPAGFDAFPCQSDRFYRSARDNKWRDSIEYCGGSNNTCTTPFVHTFADVEMVSPGVMAHIYKDAPLLPQDEDWIVLSWPHPDWMLYVYCTLTKLTLGGSTPNGEYGGASIVSKSGRRIEEIPSQVEKEFQRIAIKHGFSIDDMCISDVTECPPNNNASP